MVHVVEDFKKEKERREELLKSLGFNTYLKAAQKQDQEALINLLHQFSINMDDDSRQEIINHGTAATTIDQIIAYAAQLKAANIIQEGQKGSRKEISQQGVLAFNSIYDRVISVAKIAAKFFKDDAAKASQFSFSKVKAAINSNSTTPGKRSAPPKVH